MMKRTGVLGALLLASSWQANAADFLNDPKFRFGVGGGKFEVNYDDVGVEFDSKGWEVFAGYEFNRYFALEAGYIDAGDDTIRFEQGFKTTFESTAMYASALGSLPIGDIFSLFARAGFLHWEAELSATDGFDAIYAEDDGDEPFYGAGAAVTFDGALVRAEYRFAEMDDADLTAVSLSVIWRF